MWTVHVVHSYVSHWKVWATRPLQNKMKITLKIKQYILSALSRVSNKDSSTLTSALFMSKWKFVIVPLNVTISNWLNYKNMFIVLLNYFYFTWKGLEYEVSSANHTAQSCTQTSFLPFHTTKEVNLRTNSRSETQSRSTSHNKDAQRTQQQHLNCNRKKKSNKRGEIKRRRSSTWTLSPFHASTKMVNPSKAAEGSLA